MEIPWKGVPDVQHSECIVLLIILIRRQRSNMVRGGDSG
jgi:hypothetical protein